MNNLLLMLYYCMYFPTVIILKDYYFDKISLDVIFSTF
jgi:hypothetical protein